ncbi:MAG: cation diffusion facilitator family transporter [Gaiellaceae bacterium]
MAALAANGIITVAKLTGGFLTGSSALFAEAAHSAADTTNQGLLLMSLSLGRRKPDETHPFGHGKERFFWAFTASVMMFVAGAVFAVALGIVTLLGEEHEAKSALVAYVILGLSLVIESYALYRAVSQARGTARRRGQPFLRFVHETKDATLRVVLFEDAAAVLGVVIALVGVGLTQATGNAAWDAMASIGIGVVLVGVALELGRDIRGLLVGEAAHPDDRRRLREAIASHPEIRELVDLRTMQLGPESLLVTARVALEHDLMAHEIERVADEVDASLRRAVPAVREVFLDPTPASS